MAAKRDEDAQAATAIASAAHESVDTTATDGSEVQESAMGNIKTYSADYLDARCACQYYVLQCLSVCMY